MKIWSAKACQFCRGFKVRAKPEEYLKWQGIINAAIERAADKKIQSKAVGLQIDLMIAELTKNRAKCSFCDGTGIFSKQEK